MTTMPAPAPLILTIDDEPAIRESLEAYLEDCGYRVIQAADGRQGIEVFLQHRPDLVLVDLRMPEMDGLEVMGRITTDWPMTPVIVVSGTGVLSDAIEALRMGAWDYLTKPIEDMAVLEYAVTRALERAQLLAQREECGVRLEREVKERTAQLTQSNARLLKAISEQRQAEQRIRAQLQEKEVLLKEIHHRVKNNLQVISSLLYLQAQQIDDEAHLAVLAESRSRVKSMALVHEKLYNSEDLGRIDYAGYLEEFACYLLQTFAGEDREVDLRLDCEPVALAIDCAIPLSLLVNELVTNALKYAWNSRGHMTLSLGLHRDGEHCVLTVADDGPGLPPDLNLEDPATLGLQLVVNLARQIHGRLEPSLNNGASFSLRFAPQLSPAQ